MLKFQWNKDKYVKVKRSELDELKEIFDEMERFLEDQHREKPFILKEVKRLKEESWDKNAFDRLYDLLDELIAEKK